LILQAREKKGQTREGESYWAGKIPTPPTTELVLTLGVGPARPRARAAQRRNKTRKDNYSKVDNSISWAVDDGRAALDVVLSKAEE
jgi:hypothetical protein